MTCLPPPPAATARPAATGSTHARTAARTASTCRTAGTPPRSTTKRIALGASGARRCTSVADAITSATGSAVAGSRLLPSSAVHGACLLATPALTLVLPRICLTVRHRISTTCAAKLVCSRLVGVGSAAPMLRVVLPVIAPSTAAGWLVRGAVASVYVVAVAPIYVAIAVEIVIVVDRNVVIAAPTAAPSPSPVNGCSNHHSHAKGNRHSSCVVSGRRVVNGRIGIYRGAINDYRVITGNVDDFRLGLLNHNDALALYNLCFYLHLFVAFQVSLPLGFGAHALYCLHDVGLLRQESVTQIGRPLDVVCQPLEGVWNHRHSLDAWVPGLLFHGIDERLVLQSVVFRQPLLELHKFQWVRRGGKHLSKKRIRV